MDRSQEVSNLVRAALDQPLAARTRFLDTACRGDADLRREVEARLVKDAADASSRPRSRSA